MFGSCGANESDGANESESTTSTVNADGKEVSTIKIGNLEVMTEDLGGMLQWNDAIKACADLGYGWRLPTKDELNLLYENKEKIGGFAFNNYWSSTEFDINFAWWQYFYNGFQGFGDGVQGNGAYYVRAVRAF